VVADSRAACAGAHRLGDVREIDAVLPSTFLARAPREIAHALTSGGRRVEVRAGAVVAGTPKKAGVAIVVEGLVRVYVASAAGRQVTVRYARRGDTLGLATLFGRAMDVRAQAVARSVLWGVPARPLRAAAVVNAALANAIAEDCATLVADAVEEIALLTFGTLRQRVARHLLDLAAATPRGELVAAFTQKELADATGSAREVVGRALKELHAAGITGASREGVAILDAARLDDVARRT
jgi:CRP/FNR family transcriptional regulator